MTPNREFGRSFNTNKNGDRVMANKVHIAQVDENVEERGVQVRTVDPDSAYLNENPDVIWVNTSDGKIKKANNGSAEDLGAPASHSHTAGEVPVVDLSGKADVSHSHSVADSWLESKPITEAGYASVMEGDFTDGGGPWSQTVGKGYSIQFEAPAGGALDTLRLKLASQGAGAEWRIGVWSDDGGSGDTELDWFNYTFPYPVSNPYLDTIDISSLSIPSAGTYHLVITKANITSSTIWRDSGVNTQINSQVDNGVWTPVTYDIGADILFKKSGIVKTNESGVVDPTLIPTHSHTLAEISDYTAISIIDADATLEVNKDHFVEATDSHTLTMPTGTEGDRLRVVDYDGNWGVSHTPVVTATQKINGSDDDLNLNVADGWVEFVYVDATIGWKAITS